MSDYKEIHVFARKYKRLYTNLKTATEELLEDFRTACVAFGFDQEEHAHFIELYGEPAYRDVYAFNENHDSIDDVMVLGNAAYNRWKETVMSSYYLDDLIKKENRDWFIAAFTRLSELTGENTRKKFDYAVRLETVKIRSNKYYFGERPSPEKEMEQRLTIHSNGKVSYSRYRLGTIKGKFELIEKKNLLIEKEDAELLLHEISVYFEEEPFGWILMDQDQFEIEMTAADHREIRMTYTMDDQNPELSRLSDLIRDTLDQKELFVFDGRAEQA